MAEIILVAYGLLAFAGLALVVVGVLRRTRGLVVTGAALLLALAGAWLIGPPGILAGLLALVFVRRRR